MPRTVWSGAISFGLVTVPIKVVSATEDHSVHFQRVHTDFHQAAVIDSIGRHLAAAPFPTTPDGYRRLLEWLRSHGDVLAVGVEGTGAYGKGIAPAGCERARSPSVRPGRP